jgi:glycerol-3-phosphate dehydrogenase
MIRDIDRLTARTFDILVVGGGIYGLTIAYDAAQRGLAVALIERDDFGGASSFNHLRTIHGGLRYLQTMDLRRARESVRERAALARMAPFAVRPTPFVLPLYRSLTAGKMAMRAGFALDRLVAFDRNKGVPRAVRLPRSRTVSRAEAAHLYPGLRRQGLTGAAIWHDFVTPESDRLTFSFAIGADEHGGVLANYVEAMSPLLDGKRVTGVRARDRDTGREIEVAARLTVNATGAWVDRLLAPLGISTNMPLLKAMNLVTRRDAGEEALGGRGRSGRHFFLVPWRSHALIGTWQSERAVEADALDATAEEVASFMADVNHAFPNLELTAADIGLVHRGLVPAVAAADGRVILDGRERVRDHAEAEISGIMSVAGAKYTTARAVAERVIDRALRTLHHPPVPCRTASTALPGGSVRDPAATIAEARRDHDAGLPSDTIPHLIAAYGSRYRDVLDLGRDRPEWRTRVAADSPVIASELIWAVRKEMALTLSDALIRRTPLGALGYPGAQAVERAAAIVAAERGWSDERRRQEIEAVQQFYRSRSVS